MRIGENSHHNRRPIKVLTSKHKKQETFEKLAAQNIRLQRYAAPSWHNDHKQHASACQSLKTERNTNAHKFQQKMEEQKFAIMQRFLGYAGDSNRSTSH